MIGDILSPISTVPIYEWAAQELVLPKSYQKHGPFDVNSSRYLIEPLKALQDPDIRVVVVMAAVQMGKTLLIDLSIPHWLACRPNGPVQLTLETDQQAAGHLKNRLYPLMKSSKQLRRILPPIDKEFTNYGLSIGHCHLYANGAKPSAVQNKSICFACIDEVWRYKNTGFLAEAKARTTAFDIVGKSKTLITSQPGTVNDPMHKEFLSGTQEEWMVPCMGCGKYFIPQWRSQRENGSFFGILWDNNDTTRPEGKWNYPELLKTLRYECEFCGYKHTDTPELKSFWNNKGKYVVHNDKGIPGVRSFRWNAISAFPWDVLLNKFIKAKEAWDIGLKEEMREFQQQRLAKPYDPFGWKSHRFVNTDHYDVDRDWDKGMCKIMSIDVQRDHFWCEVREWAEDGDSRQLFFGKCLNDDVHELIKRWQIPKTHVFVDVAFVDKDEDSGQRLVHQWVAEHGFVGLRGDHWANSRGGYEHTIRGAKIKLLYSPRKLLAAGGKQTVYFNFAPNAVRDIFTHLLRHNQGEKWKCLANEEYERHVNAEKKIKIPTKYGWDIKWVNKNSTPNHGFDTGVMNCVAALMHPKINIG